MMRNYIITAIRNLVRNKGSGSLVDQALKPALNTKGDGGAEHPSALICVHSIGVHPPPEPSGQVREMYLSNAFPQIFANEFRLDPFSALPLDFVV